MTQATINLAEVPGSINNSRAVKLGPFQGGLHNTPGSGEQILDSELYQLINMEVDYDGTLANRPEIRVFNTTSNPDKTEITIIGTYTPIDNRKFLVVYLPVSKQVALVNAQTGAFTTYAPNCKSFACVQYGNKVWVVATHDSPGVGGYFDAPTTTTTTWTTVASMPRGESIDIYRDRLFIACGQGATSNASRFYYSPVAPGAGVVWATSTDFWDVVPGNGQKLVAIVTIGNDLIALKEHSTHKWTYTTDPRKAELSPIDARIGIPTVSCYTLYKSNTLYVLHDDGVYEMFQYKYEKISSNLNMYRDTDTTLYSKDYWGISHFRERLFVRFYTHMYVFGLEIGAWCEWNTDRKFREVFFIPSDTLEIGMAYAATASRNHPTSLYFIKDDRRITATGATEAQGPAEYISSYSKTETSVTSMVMNIPPGTVDGDWMYLCITHEYLGSAVTITPADATWETVLPYTSSGPPGTMNMQVWRVKRDALITQYTFTFNTATTYQAIIHAVRGGGPDFELGTFKWDSTTVGIMEAPRDVVDGKAMVLCFFAAKFATIQTHTFNCTDMPAWDMVPFPAGTNQRFQFGGYQAYANAGDTFTVSVAITSFPVENFNSIALNIIIPPKYVLSDPDAEIFKGQIMSKTYDFQIPHTYKVLFWWGLNVATSGNFTAELTTPQPDAGLTWREAKDTYTTYDAAIENDITWGGVQPIKLSETIAPALGKYARKFIKLLKKVRFRQVYFKINFDIYTNRDLADASLRLYDVYMYIKSKETVAKKTN